MKKEKLLPRRMRKSLDLDNFQVIRIISQGESYPVILMRDKRADSFKPWCIQYRGTGRYFQTLKEANNYMATRNWIKIS